MAITSPNNGNGTLAEMNTTPLIDVMLVLLVMLIVTIPIQTHAVKLMMPGVSPPAPLSVVHTLAVDFDGAIAWDGRPVSRAALDAEFRRIARQADQDEIHVAPDRLARYGLVAQLLADAKRIGARKIGFSGEERYLR